MRTKSTSLTTFLIARVLLGSALYSVGLLLASLGLSQTVTGTIAAKAPAQTPGMWTRTGSMTAGREGHTATLLPNGQVLVAGGYQRNNPLTTAELYEPVTSVPGLLSAASRLTHRSAGTFDLNLPLTGDPGIEGRYGPAPQTIVFTFNSNVTAADSVITSCGTAGQASIDPNNAHNLLVILTAQSCDEQ